MKKKIFKKIPISFNEISQLQSYVNNSKDFFIELEKIRKKYDNDFKYELDDFANDVLALYDDFKLNINVK